MYFLISIMAKYQPAKRFNSHQKLFVVVCSGGSGPGPTRALTLASKLAVNFIHGKINKHFASSARINKDCHSDKDTEGVRKDE